MSTMMAERPRAATRPVVPWAALLLAAVAAGVLFRAAQFLSRQSFHGDEVGLLVNWAAFTFSPDPHGPRDVRDRLDRLRASGRETGPHLLVRGAAAYEFERK